MRVRRRLPAQRPLQADRCSNSVTAAQVAAQPELRRELGLRDLVLTQVLFVVGLPWIGVAGKLGPSHVVYWLLAIVTFYLPCAAVVIFLNTSMPLEGGLYQWAKLTFNPFTGFMVGWNLWLYVIVLTSETGLQIMANLAYALGPEYAWLAGSKLWITLVSCSSVALLVWVSVVGLGIGKWVHNAGGIVIIAIFFVIIAFALASGNYHPWRFEVPAASLFGLNILSKLGFGALGGFEYVAILAGECRSPARSIANSVLIAAPIIALMFILGTSAMITLVPIDQIDLIGPISQVLHAGAKPFGVIAKIVPVAVFMVIGLRVAQASVNFTGNTRLPMVAGWDRILPSWFTKLNPKRRTPVNSIMLAGAAVLAMGLASLIGVGHQESFQTLWNAATTFYAIPYLVMFAIPLFSRKLEGVPLWLKIAAVSGLVMTALNIGFSVLPIIDVQNTLAFTMKIGGVIVAGNAIGAAVFLLRSRQVL